MCGFQGDQGQKLGVAPTHLVTGSGSFFKVGDMLLSATVNGSSNTDHALLQFIKSSI